MSAPARLAVFISGRGTGLQSIIDAAKAGELTAEIVLVVSSNPDASGLERARMQGIDTFIYCPRAGERAEAIRRLLTELEDRNTEWIALAGFIKLIPTALLAAYPGHVVNIHPALLPKYGGKGMYGANVHRAVLEAGDTESGATVHLVDEIYDHGKVLEQAQVPVKPGDTIESLAARVLEQEHRLYPKVLQKLITGKYADHYGQNRSGD